MKTIIKSIAILAIALSTFAGCGNGSEMYTVPATVYSNSADCTVTFVDYNGDLWEYENYYAEPLDSFILTLDDCGTPEDNTDDVIVNVTVAE